MLAENLHYFSWQLQLSCTMQHLPCRCRDTPGAHIHVHLCTLQSTGCTNLSSCCPAAPHGTALPLQEHPRSTHMRVPTLILRPTGYTHAHTHTWAAAELLLHARSPDTTGTAPLLAPAAAAAAPRARWRPKLDEGAAMRVAVTASPALSTACTGARPVKNLWACGLRVRVPVLLKVLSPALHARAPGQCGP